MRLKLSLSGVSEEEKAEWKKAAKRDNFTTLSQWVRHVCNTAVKDNQG